jgi:preprotein translocase subunit SecA
MQEIGSLPMIVARAGALASVAAEQLRVLPADAHRAPVELRRLFHEWTGGKFVLATNILAAVNALEPTLTAESDADLARRSAALRYRAKVGEPWATLVSEVFALAREAGRRARNMRHYDVQILGGLVMARRGIAEMQTGEGKTLTATLPMYLFALAGKGALLATVNDYLAERDAELMRPVYHLLGMTTGVIKTDQTPDERRAAYACDITYGTAKEFGFDYLRDRLLLRRQSEQAVDRLGAMLGHRLATAEKPVQRSVFFALIDEADSILIDEAGTPLIIGTVGEDHAQRICRYRFACRMVDEFNEGKDYELDRPKRRAELTSAGRRKARSLRLPELLGDLGLPRLYEDLERALSVMQFYHRDHQYVVMDGEIQIVDEFTGRIAEGRKWRDGIHQAVEAKEGLNISADGGQAARITIQDFFRRFRHLGGMSGTVISSAREMRRIYRLKVRAIPTHRPPIRQRLPRRLFLTAEEKWQAIVDEVVELHATGRPTLIGTRSIERSEALSHLLKIACIPHQVLNAHHVAAESQIVAHAGQQRRVTVATNMAGRGTDIKLGPAAHELGGMHVICSELSDSPRIDRQLIGRCGRQGDPGSYRQYFSLEDDLLVRGLGFKAAAAIVEAAHRECSAVDEVRQKKVLARYAKYFYQAQRALERRSFRQRQSLLQHEKQVTKARGHMGLDSHLDVPD